MTLTNMHHILILNSKGGCGKTTISVNIASFFACWGVQVALADFDKQHSSTDWLRCRSKDNPRILSVAAWQEDYHIPDEAEYVIMDTPAGLDGEAMLALLKKADTILIPILPSPLDIRAAGRLIHDIMQQYNHLPNKPRIGIIANRVRRQTKIYNSLKRFIDKLDIDFIASLRDTQNYITSTSTGTSLFELPNWKKQKDLTGWCQLINWINYNEIFEVPKLEDTA
ncbi:MAG: ParA family protein [Gammaproteobacteria bacterium]|nr:ParA family protein [Gammaproteobacteria bacterium]